MGPSFPRQAVSLTSSAASSETPRQQCRTPLPVKSPGSGSLLSPARGHLGLRALLPQCSAALVGPERSLQPQPRTEPWHTLFPSLPGGRARPGKGRQLPVLGLDQGRWGRGTERGRCRTRTPCTRNSDHRS